MDCQLIFTHWEAVVAVISRSSVGSAPRNGQIELSRSLVAQGLPLRIAAKVDKVDRAYHEAKIKPMLKDPRVEFIGEIGDNEKRAFYGEAIALLFPIDWPEPFGLVLIEAIGNATPVIAFRRGAVPEIIGTTA